MRFFFFFISFYLAPLAPAHSVWTTDADGSVTLRSSSREDCEYEPQTVHTFLKRVVDKFPEKDALSIKRNGIWIQWTYAQYYECCRTVAKAFLKVGMMDPIIAYEFRL